MHVSGLLARWQATVADIYIKFGASPAVADDHATVLLSALQGALILARARRKRLDGPLTAPTDAERQGPDRSSE